MKGKGAGQNIYPVFLEGTLMSQVSGWSARRKSDLRLGDWRTHPKALPPTCSYNIDTEYKCKARPCVSGGN